MLNGQTGATDTEQVALPKDDKMIDFLGIGAQKSGTTWLMNKLRQHPEVWTPSRMKEVHYFDVLYLGVNKESRLKIMRRKYKKILKKESRANVLTRDRRLYLKKAYDPHSAFTDEWYRDIFSIATDRIKGEITPLYCALGKRGISHIRELMPDVKLIYIIRDPYDRAMSSLRMQLDRDDDARRSMEGIINDPVFLLKGDYARNIPAWESMFHADQIHYIPFGRIRSDPVGILRDLENYLGLTPLEHYEDIATKVNATGKKGKKHIPKNIQHKIRKISEKQYIFLKARFGEEFVTSTR
jgi:hypothetical protein